MPREDWWIKKPLAVRALCVWLGLYNRVSRKEAPARKSNQMRRKRNGWLGAVIVGVVALVAICAVSREPSYKGRNLTHWLQQCYDSSLDETQKISQAHQAINAMGAEKVVPVLLDMVKAKDGPIRSWIIQKNEKWDIKALRLREAATIRQMGVEGFEALGTNGAPAIGELTAMLNDTNGGPTGIAFVALLMRLFRCW